METGIGGWKKATDLRLNQITIKVSDLARSIAFYEILGLRVIVNTGNPYARFECADGGTTFSLSESEEPVVPGETGLYFEVGNVAATVEELAARGIEFDSPVTQEPWLWTESWFRDPDGHKLCIYHAGKARRFPPWRLDGAKR